MPSIDNIEEQNFNDDVNKAKKKYVDLLKANDNSQHENKVLRDSIGIKPVEYKNGVPRVTQTKEEVQKMNVLEDLHLVVIG